MDRLIRDVSFTLNWLLEFRKVSIISGEEGFGDETTPFTVFVVRG